MKVLKIIVLYCLFGISIYMGFVRGHDGAYNIAMFFAWFSIACSFLLFSDSILEKMKQSGRTMPSWIHVSVDIAVVSIFVWYGALFTGALYLLHTLITEAAWSKALEE